MARQVSLAKWFRNSLRQRGQTVTRYVPRYVEGTRWLLRRRKRNFNVQCHAPIFPSGGEEGSVGRRTVEAIDESKFGHGIVTENDP